MPTKKKSPPVDPALLEACELTLRRLQILDEAVSCGRARPLLTMAQDDLAAILGISCNGRPEADGVYSHSGYSTCRVHEWLAPADQADVQRLWSASDETLVYNAGDRALIRRALREHDDRAAALGTEEGMAQSDATRALLRRIGGDRS